MDCRVKPGNDEERNLNPIGTPFSALLNSTCLVMAGLVPAYLVCSGTAAPFPRDCRDNPAMTTVWR